VSNREAIAIIPARGGSKRLPKKNILDFFGRPMIAWTVQAALESECFDRVLVSTDSSEIAEVAKQWGAEVPFLRQTAADDQTPVSEATIAALNQAMSYWQEDYASVVQLMPNCPLRSAKDIQTAIADFASSTADFQISCFRFGWMNPWWSVTLTEDGQPQPQFPQAQTQRSQDLPPLYCPTGAIWVARSAPLLKAKSFYGPGHRFHPISWIAAVDIDDAEDLDFARATYLFNEQQTKSAADSPQG